MVTKNRCGWWIGNRVLINVGHNKTSSSIKHLGKHCIGLMACLSLVWTDCVLRNCVGHPRLSTHGIYILRYWSFLTKHMSFYIISGSAICTKKPESYTIYVYFTYVSNFWYTHARTHAHTHTHTHTNRHTPFYACIILVVHIGFT